MFFTTIITTKNRLSLLKRAFQSVKQQTFQTEIIIADDYSDDGTEEYVRSLKDQVIYLRNSESLGQSKSINYAITRATGKWIKLLDDDDFLNANCLAEMYQAINAHPQAIICSCQAVNIKTNGQIIGQTIKHGDGKICYVKQKDIHYGMFMEILPVGTPTQISFKRETFLKTSGWNPDFDGFGNDTDSWLEMAKYGDLLFINEPLAFRTISETGYSQKHNIQTRIDYQLRLKQKMLNLMHPNYQKSCSLKQIRSFLLIYWGIICLKNYQFSSGFSLLQSSIFAKEAWEILITVIYSRQIKKISSNIYQALKN